MKSKRILKVVAALIGVIAITPLAQAAAPVQTYYYLVFSNPTEGQEDRYNKWYDAQHVPDVLSVPGFVSGERFRINDIQMYPGVKVAMPRYLVRYVIRTHDLDGVMKEVFRRLQAGETVIDPSFDGKSSLGYLYRATTSFKRTIPDPTSKVKGERNNYLHIVFTYPKPEKVAEFDPWYDKVHAPSMMKGPGYISAQRAVLAQPAPRASIQPSDAIAMFSLSLPTDITIDKAREKIEPGTPNPGILDPTRNRGYSYRAIGPVVDAGPIQKARAAAKKKKKAAMAPTVGGHIAAAPQGTMQTTQFASSFVDNCRHLLDRVRAAPAEGSNSRPELFEQAESEGCLE